MARTKETENAKKQNSSSASSSTTTAKKSASTKAAAAAAAAATPKNLIIEGKDGEIICRRCYEGPSWKKGHAYTCKQSKFYNMSAEEIDDLQRKEAAEYVASKKKQKRKVESSSSSSSNKKKKKKAGLTERNLIIEIDGQEVCKRCHLGSSFKKGHVSTCEHSKYYIG